MARMFSKSRVIAGTTGLRWRRVGEVGEDRSRHTVEQNVFSRALGQRHSKGVPHRRP